jgi:hypothetical protein
MLEAGSLAGLPAPVFVRGFIRSYAKAVGIADGRPLSLYDRAVNADSEATRTRAITPVVDPVVAGVEPGLVGAIPDDDEGRRRPGLGMAVFVIILVLIATITLSLLLRRPPQSGEGLSLSRPAGGAPALVDGHDRTTRA